MTDVKLDLSIDLSKSGLEMFFPHYGAKILDHMWDNDEITMESGMSSGKAHVYLEEVGVKNPNTGRPISRASVIFFLNRLVDLSAVEETASRKGNCHLRHRQTSLELSAHSQVVVKRKGTTANQTTASAAVARTWSALVLKSAFSSAFRGISRIRSTPPRPRTQGTPI